jgi:hypothetical protein
MSRCAAVETLLALAERLTTPINYMTKPTSERPQGGDPYGGHEFSSNLPRESVDPQGRHGKVRIGQRDKNVTGPNTLGVICYALGILV